MTHNRPYTVTIDWTDRIASVHGASSVVLQDSDDGFAWQDIAAAADKDNVPIPNVHRRFLRMQWSP